MGRPAVSREMCNHPLWSVIVVNAVIRLTVVITEQRRPDS